MAAGMNELAVIVANEFVDGYRPGRAPSIASTVLSTMVVTSRFTG
jgi:hypothetical protein